MSYDSLTFTTICYTKLNEMLWNDNTCYTKGSTDSYGFLGNINLESEFL